MAGVYVEDKKSSELWPLVAQQAENGQMYREKNTPTAPPGTPKLYSLMSLFSLSFCGVSDWKVCKEAPSLAFRWKNSSRESWEFLKSPPPLWESAVGNVLRSCWCWSLRPGGDDFGSCLWVNYRTANCIFLPITSLSRIRRCGRPFYCQQAYL